MPQARLCVTTLEDRLTPVTVPDRFGFSLVTSGLTAPTAFTTIPDGRVLVTEQHGGVRVIDSDGDLEATPAIQLAVDSRSERGLLGITLDPAFTTNGHIFLYYTTPISQTVPIHNRVSRFTMTGNIIDPTSEVVIVDLDPVDQGAHNGGAIKFGRDGKLYVAVGENAVPPNAQLPNTYFGKILRFNPDGSIPADNPTIAGLVTQPTGKYRAIYAAGLRNPFTFDIEPNTGEIYINDVGQNFAEEVNVLAAGNNYGWPLTEGTFEQSAHPNLTQPIISYLHGPGTTRGFAITGGTFYVPANVAEMPADFAEYAGDYYYADFVNGWIRRYDVATQTDELFAFDMEGLNVLGLTTGSDGSLLVLSFGAGQPGDGSVFRIAYTDTPQFVAHPQSAVELPGGTATFSVEVSSGTPVTYQWQRNGVDIPNATAATYVVSNLQPADTGATFRVVVTNATASATSDPATLTVTTNLPPVPRILTPTLGTTFAYGQTIAFSGDATDPEDGAVPASALSWRVDYITGNAAPRPFFPETSGIASGTVTLPTVSPYTRTDVKYRFILTARDAAGNARSVTREILPVVGTATLTTDFPQVVVSLDGRDFEAPYPFEGVVGQDRTISATAVAVIGGQSLPFRGWSDGVLERTRTGSVAADGITYRAIYSPTFDIPLLPRIVTPAVGATFTYGQTIAFSGEAIDAEDGAIPLSDLSWRVDYIRDGIAPQPFLPEKPGIAGGSVTLPTSLPYTGTDVTYRFTFTARDSAGVPRRVTRDLIPVVGSATVISNLDTAPLAVDGVEHTLPYTFDGIVGQQRTISAVAFFETAGLRHDFLGWSDGVAERTRIVSVAKEGITFRAIYSNITIPTIAVGNGGALSQSAVGLNAQTGAAVQSFDLLAALPAGTPPTETRVAQGDVNGDGVADTIIATGPGAPAFVVVFDGSTRAVLSTFMAFEATFTGGAFVAGGDIDGDGRADVIVSPDEGGGPRVRVFRDGNPEQVLADFFGIDDPNFRGGARVSVGDVSGDGRADLVVAAGFGGGPRVATYDGTSIATNTPVQLFGDFFAFETTLRNGVYIAVGDVNGDGRGDLIAGGGPGGGPRVAVFSGGELMSTGTPVFLANFFAGDLQSRSGVRVGVTDFDFDDRADVVVGSAGDSPDQIQIYRGTDVTASGLPIPAEVYTAFGDDFTSGVYVG